LILKTLHERSELLFISHTQDFNTTLPLLPLMAKKNHMTVKSEAEKIDFVILDESQSIRGIVN